MVKLVVLLAALAVPWSVASADPGCRGIAFERLASGAIGPPIPNVEITFIPENSSASFVATTAANGSYSIGLTPGRYYWIARHASFADDTSAPGLAVVSGTVRGTLNIFLSAPSVTTVLLVRHAEKQDPNSNAPAEPLSTLGAARAQELKRVLFRAGVSAVYSTDTVRTRSTVKPLADAFRMTTNLYSDPAAVAAQILADHPGDVVLVAGHSNTVGPLIAALGAVVPTAAFEDFDNLFLVSRAGSSAASVNLQYGANSTPDAPPKNAAATARTFLLFGTAASAASPASQLAHAVTRAGAAAIATLGTNPLSAALGTALGLTPASFTAAQRVQTVNNILNGPAGVTALSAGRATLSAIVNQAGARPTPIIYPTDRNHLIVVTRFASGAARTIPLLY